jgi:sugar phosphate isomerase/epimerase
VVDLIGLGPFHLARPERWEAQRERLTRAVETAATLGIDLIVFTTGPFAPLTWDEAADALAHALAPVLASARSVGVTFAIEHTNSLRVDVGFVHTMRDAIDLARRLDVKVCM